MYLRMSEHQSFPYGERVAKEVAGGVALTAIKTPLSCMLISLEKRLYPSNTPLGITPNLLKDKNFRNFARFGSPVIEELLFRGALLNCFHAVSTKYFNMKDTHAAIASSVANSLIFSAMHSKGMRLHTFAGGMLYSGVTYYSGSLFPAISAHITTNNIACAALMSRLKKT